MRLFEEENKDCFHKKANHSTFENEQKTKLSMQLFYQSMYLINMQYVNYYR